MHAHICRSATFGMQDPGHGILRKLIGEKLAKVTILYLLSSVIVFRYSTLLSICHLTSDNRTW